MGAAVGLRAQELLGLKHERENEQRKCLGIGRTALQAGICALSACAKVGGRSGRLCSSGGQQEEGQRRCQQRHHRRSVHGSSSGGTGGRRRGGGGSGGGGGRGLWHLSRGLEVRVRLHLQGDLLAVGEGWVDMLRRAAEAANGICTGAGGRGRGCKFWWRGAPAGPVAGTQQRSRVHDALCTHRGTPCSGDSDTSPPACRPTR